MQRPRTAIIVSVSSDIGTAMARRWRAAGWNVVGTYRTRSAEVDRLSKEGVFLVECDLAHPSSIEQARERLLELAPAWHVLVVAPGAQEPIGPFIDERFDDWEESIGVNFTGQVRITHGLLPRRARWNGLEPLVLFFAGGGTNNATVNYSAYTVSKIALIKMCELLDAEIKDARFAILGPGWVKTKIHDPTLRAGDRAGRTLDITRKKLASAECTPMDLVLDCCDWLADAPRALIGGRNFSVAFDRWGTKELAAVLREDRDMYKLRRAGNDELVRPGAPPRTPVRTE